MLWITGGAKPTRGLPSRDAHELMDKRKAPDVRPPFGDGLAFAGLSWRPCRPTPGVPADRVKLLRDAFNKALTAPGELVAEAKTRGWELEPVTGEELETIGKRVMTQH